MSTLFPKVMRFAAVGVIATLTHVAVFTLAVEVGRIEAVAANALAFSVAVLVGYALNRRWTFAASGGVATQLSRYVAASLFGLAVNSAIMFVVVHGLQWSPYVGLVIGLLLMPPLTFALNHLWVFRPPA